MKSRMLSYHALHPCPLPRPEYSLNRLAADPHLFHPLPSLPLPQHPQRLPSLSYPSISLLLVKLVKHFCWMLPSYLQWPCHTYLAFGGDKGTKLRIRLTRNGISCAGEVYGPYTSTDFDKAQKHLQKLIRLCKGSSAG